MDKGNAKQRIEGLITKFQRIVDEDKLRGYSEERTKNEFIEPLFEALGWDMRNERTDDEVIKEQRVLRGRADYAFRLDGVIRFFVEAKGAKANLDNSEFAKQAISYGFNKGVTWAVLTDFEGLKVFNCEWNEQNIWRNQVFELRYTQFLNEFDKLWLLSKEAFDKNAMVDYAITVGKRTPRKSVSELLLKELLVWRAALSKDIKKAHPDKYSQEEIDEIVQRIIDRLIFIRACEDRKIEGNKLKESMNAYREKGGSLSRELKEIFGYYRENYDSKLFGRTAEKEHEADKVKVTDTVLDGVIDALYYSKDGNVRYDFALIDADVLGNVYEQYLGSVLRTTAKRAKLSGGKSHRKEQGIYYTPTYIVDYIVKNTLGELIKKKKPADVDKIRVLDPACGSGSFLIKAFDVLDEYYMKNDKQYAQSKLGDDGARITKKIEILKNNIHGVDLDEKAVEIAQLNLLLKMTEKRHLLPSLEGSIKCGNSLIDDSGVAGDKTFDWNDNFENVMKEGGFDVIIGNPPYIRLQTMNKKDVNYFSSNYEAATRNYDMYCLFVEKGLSLLREGGVLGYILPSKFFTAEYGKGLRKVIHTKKALHKIVDFKQFQVFSGATTYTCLLFLKKGTKQPIEYTELKTTQTKNDQSLNETNLSKSVIPRPTEDDPWILASSSELPIINKLKKSPKLGDIAQSIFVGVQTSADKALILSGVESTKLVSVSLKEEVALESPLLKPVLSGVDVKRYQELKTRQHVVFPYVLSEGRAVLLPFDRLQKTYPKLAKYLIKNKSMLENREKGKMKGSKWYAYVYPKNLAKQHLPKICIPRLAHRINAVYDSEGEFCLDNVDVNGVILDNNDDYEYVTAILNSKLLTFYLTKISTPFRGGFYSCNKQYLERLPIANASEKNKTSIIKLAKVLMRLTSKCAEFGDKQTDARAKLEKEIVVIDAKIDKLVYDIYGLSAKERRIVEETIS
ncbi:Eco57I restriction-modification methylase domain-containing protein [archaeon]